MATPEIQAVAAGFVAAGTSVVGPMVAVDPSLLWSLMQIFQRFFYFQFCNIELLKNLKSFLLIFSLGRLKFLPNVGDINLFEDIEIPSPAKSYGNGYRGLFLYTTGHTLFLWLAMLFIYPVILLLEKKFSHKGRIFSEKMISRKFKLEIVPSTWEGTMSEFLYAAFLQFLGSPIFNFVIFLSFTFSVISILVVCWFGIKKFKELKGQPASTPPIQRWLPFVEYIMKIGQPFSLVYFYNYPFHQLSFLWGFNIAVLVLYLVGNIREDARKIFGEVVCLFTHLLMTFFGYSNITPSSKETLGLLVFLLCILVIAVELIFAIRQEIKTFISNWNKPAPKARIPARLKGKKQSSLKKISPSSFVLDIEPERKQVGRRIKRNRHRLVLNE